MNNKLKALIIGGNGSLGKSFQISLENRNYETCHTYYKNKISDTNSYPLNLDSSEMEIEDSLENIRNNFGVPDLLIIASGTACYNPLNKTTNEDFNHTLNVDLIGPIRVVKYFLPHFLERKSGIFHIVSAIAGVMPAVKNMSVYTSAKFGLVGFVRSLATELVGTGVKASVSCPGGIKTNLPDNALGDKESLVKFFQQYGKSFHEPTEIADLILNKLDSREVLIFPTDSAKKLFEDTLSKPFWI
jgi:NAD(P)-dependent dehydrogenase (short-subunit alcohol dehydrogenase family)